MSTEAAAVPAAPLDRTFRRVLIFFALVMAVLASVAVVTLVNLSRTTATSDWVNHTHALLTEVDTLQPNLAAAEGLLGKYLATGETSDQAACQEKFAELGESVEVVRALVAGSPTDRDLFAPIQAQLEHRATQAAELIRLRKGGDQAALRRAIAADTETAERGDLARGIESFRARHTDLLSERDRSAFVQAHSTRWMVVTGLAFNFLLLVGAAWLIRDDLAARRQATQLLQRSNAELEDRVRMRTAEITAANAQLRAQNLEERWAKQAIEHQNRYNLLIIDSISDAVFVATKLMNISRMNPAAVHLTGYEPVDLIDRPIARVLQLAARDIAATTFDPLVRTLADGHELLNQPGVVLGKNDRTIPVVFSVYPLRDRDQVVGGVIIVRAQTRP